jgi:uncharacterized protein YeaO (DUF488 family)
MSIRTKRAYDNPSPADGRRILVDRLWPRGISKADAKIDFWAKAIAPSNELRRWYQHEGSKWPEFKRRYFAELANNTEAVDELRDRMGSGPVTFVFSSRETERNNASALKEYLES